MKRYIHVLTEQLFGEDADRTPSSPRKPRAPPAVIGAISVINKFGADHAVVRFVLSGPPKRMAGPDVAALAADLARAVELTMSVDVSQTDRLKAYNACESFKVGLIVIVFVLGCE